MRGLRSSRTRGKVFCATETVEVTTPVRASSILRLVFQNTSPPVGWVKGAYGAAHFTCKR